METNEATGLPAAVNFHINRTCHAHCHFCFATFRDVEGQLTPARARRVLELLAEAGARKINFAGGEPTLHPHLGGYLRHARGLGLTTSVVTNGARLGALLDLHAVDVDWVGFSVDSGDEGIEVVLGRGRGDHVARAISLADRCHAARVWVKLNTVVTRLNWHEDLTPLVRRVAPARWKVFQVLPVGGQNEGGVGPLSSPRSSSAPSWTGTRRSWMRASGRPSRTTTPCAGPMR